MKCVLEKPKRPDDDVYLTDGEAFFTEKGPYDRHVEMAIDIKGVRDFRCLQMSAGTEHGDVARCVQSPHRRRSGESPPRGLQDGVGVGGVRKARRRIALLGL